VGIIVQSVFVGARKTQRPSRQPCCRTNLAKTTGIAPLLDRLAQSGWSVDWPEIWSALAAS